MNPTPDEIAEEIRKRTGEQLIAILKELAECKGQLAK